MNKPFALVIVGIAAAMVVTPRLHRRIEDSRMEAVPTETARLVFLERKFFAAEYVRPDDLKCVMMEWNTGGDTVATLAAFDDGETSLYLSTGRGILNVRSRNVRAAASRFRELAADRVDQFGMIADYDPPRSGRTRFYLITGSQTLATQAQPTGSLVSQYSVLKELTEAGQATIAEILKKT